MFFRTRLLSVIVAIVFAGSFHRWFYVCTVRLKFSNTFFLLLITYIPFLCFYITYLTIYSYSYHLSDQELQ